MRGGGLGLDKFQMWKKNFFFKKIGYLKCQKQQFLSKKNYYYYLIPKCLALGKEYQVRYYSTYSIQIIYSAKLLQIQSKVPRATLLTVEYQIN